jgi:hypothetical protein
MRCVNAVAARVKKLNNTNSGPSNGRPASFSTKMRHMNNLRRVTFADTGWAIDLLNCDDVIAHLPSAFAGWDLRVGLPTKKPPRAIISKRRHGWTWQVVNGAKPRDWDSIPPQSAMRVVTDIHDAAIYWYLHEHPQTLCIHGAAAKFNKGVLCFPARGKSGKSTLMACLAAEKIPVLADDVIGLKSNQALALGFAPRLRTPLPPVLSHHVREHVRMHTAYEANGWHYLKPAEDCRVAFAEKHPFVANVLLQRVESGEASLVPARTADVLHALIAENIIRILPMETIFNRLHRFAKSHEKYFLTYSDPQDAAQLLIKTFQ